MNIIIITPVRNEGLNIQTTIECMLSQTLKPVEWIIVNDGSTDNTESIIKKYSNQFSFIKYINREDRGYRKPGQGVIESFYKGFENVENENFEIISKFDADLKFPSDTLEKISDEFANNPNLGITGGIRLEKGKNDKFFKRVLVPNGFVSGAFKFYRKECFKNIGGLIKRAGWDGVDTIKANMKGWQTGEIESLKFIHLKPTGSARGEGLSNSYKKCGNVSYYMGGYFWYFILRVLGRSLINRDPRVGFYMTCGYLNSTINAEDRQSREFRRHLKKVQLQNIRNWVLMAYKSFSETFSKV